MAVYTMANATISIGTTAVADDLTSYAADTYQEIGNVQTISALIDEQSFAEFIGLASARPEQLKTIKRGQNVTVTVGYDPDDTGQDAVRAAAAVTTQDRYNFKVVYNDSGSSNATTIYWSGKVGNDAHPGGGAEDVALVDYILTNDTGFTVEYRA